MGSDNFHHKRKENKKLKLRSSTWLICTEGKETEVNYIEGLFACINKKLPSDLKIRYEVEGLGMNTLSLVEKAEDLNDKVIDIVSKKSIPYGKVFVVFDKDSFSTDAFNKAVYLCEQNGYIPCFSNECFEYFLLQHFIDCKSALNREQLLEKVEEHFKKWHLTYAKNDQFLFTNINKIGNVKLAYKRCYKGYEEQKNLNPSKMIPVSTVFRIFDEINIRQKERGLEEWDKLI